MKVELRTSKLGVIVGNRGFFPAHLAESGRKTILKVMEEEGIPAFCLTPEETKYGAVLTLEDSAEMCQFVQGAPRRDRWHPDHTA